MIKIVFKKADDEIFAVFPYESFDNYLTSYAHIGQHSLCAIDYAYDAKNASEDEYKELLEELINIYGKELVVLKKCPHELGLRSGQSVVIYLLNTKNKTLYFITT